MTDVAQSTIRRILTDLSGVLDDGVSFGAVDVNGETVRVVLEIDRAVCEECLTPTVVLEAILLKRFSDAGLGLKVVEVVEGGAA